ncbi:MAG: aminotransferase class I/II-fold pyridoxal phosphate-dependent enzyme [Elusimicrobia bacterium]|nr:aminotransferase class I/II-fold pyridoxal phosphate-dependent enzyme [Elusimicrobiota bacterium]
MAAGVVGSEILRIASEIRALSAGGKDVCNLTVGDFGPSEFRVPKILEKAIGDALARGETNYPPSDGMPGLRQAVADFYARTLGLRFPVQGILITGGARPAIYGAYRAVLDPGDTVVYPVPSWNSNHYCHLAGARGVAVPCGPEEGFLPSARGLAGPLRGARLLALNSPLNPSGTAFAPEALGEICDLVLEENARRGRDERPLFVLYDQVYWMLTFGSTRHVEPVGLRPAMAPFTIFVDGISKPFAATGLRVGWAAGPPDLINRMSQMLGHVGAWAPRPEQVATAALLADEAGVAAYRREMTAGVSGRLDALYEGFVRLKSAGHPVEALCPAGAIYLAVRLDLIGRRTPDKTSLRSNEEIRLFLLREAGLAAVPFQAFGVPDDTGWFRLSVGAVSPAAIARMLPRLRSALESLESGPTRRDP